MVINTVMLLKVYITVEERWASPRYYSILFKEKSELLTLLLCDYIGEPF